MTHALISAAAVAIAVASFAATGASARDAGEREAPLGAIGFAMGELETPAAENTRRRAAPRAEVPNVETSNAHETTTVTGRNAGRPAE